MKKRLLWLYPRRWRERYGREFDALLEQGAWNWTDYLDILKGGIFMRLTSWIRRPAWQTLTLFVLLGAIAGAIATQIVQTEYVSSVTLEIQGGPEAVSEINPLLKDILSRKGLTAVINQLDLYREQRTTMPLEDIVERMRQNIRVFKNPGSSIEVWFTHTDARVAQLVTRELSRLITTNIAQSQATETRLVIDQKDLAVPAIPIFPNHRNIVIAGALCGLLAGSTLAALNARMRRLDHHSA
jgi:hypothetical protein